VSSAVPAVAPLSADEALLRLSAAGRAPVLPVSMEVAGAVLTLQRGLRVLPGRRITAWADWAGRPVIAKLFFASPKALREAESEASRLAEMARRGIPAPALLADGGSDRAGRILILEALPGETALTLYRQAHGEGQGADFIVRLLSFVAELHDHGCMQEDPHLGNFLIDGQRIYLLDAGGVALHERLSAAQRCHNLALLLAQFYPLDTLDSTALLAAYGSAAPSVAALEESLAQARVRRYRHAMDKLYRDCTEFARLRVARMSGMAVRAAAADLQALLEAGIDQAMAGGVMLKNGNSSTVCRVQWRGHDWVIKRYNIKNLWHLGKKQFKPSRARRSWRNARWLDLVGVATPEAVGYVEHRRSGVLGTAYYVSDYTAGKPVDTLSEPELGRAREAVDALFSLMALLRFSHGDMKASNFLWQDGRLWVLDLDAMRLGLSPGQAEKWIQRDRTRWQCNWTG